MPSSLSIPTPTMETTNAIERHCKAIMSIHCPKYYAGKIASFNAKNHDDFGCDPAELWRGMATKMECRTIAGTHVGIVAADTSLTELAAALDASLAACLPSTP
jgi:hypothetical protein